MTRRRDSYQIIIRTAILILSGGYEAVRKRGLINSDWIGPESKDSICEEVSYVRMYALTNNINK